MVTRENNRLLATGKQWVKNGDRWTVTATHKDGSTTVKRAGGGGEVAPRLTTWPSTSSWPTCPRLIGCRVRRWIQRRYGLADHHV